MRKIKPGDVVRLKGGDGPVMTVGCYDGDAFVCIWGHGSDVHTKTLPVAALELCDDDEDENEDVPEAEPLSGEMVDCRPRFKTGDPARVKRTEVWMTVADVGVRTGQVFCRWIGEGGVREGAFPPDALTKRRLPVISPGSAISDFVSGLEDYVAPNPDDDNDD